MFRIVRTTPTRLADAFNPGRAQPETVNEDADDIETFIEEGRRLDAVHNELLSYNDVLDEDYAAAQVVASRMGADAVEAVARVRGTFYETEVLPDSYRTYLDELTPGQTQKPYPVWAAEAAVDLRRIGLLDNEQETQVREEARHEEWAAADAQVFLDEQDSQEHEAGRELDEEAHLDAEVSGTGDVRDVREVAEERPARSRTAEVERLCERERPF